MAKKSSERVKTLANILNTARIERIIIPLLIVSIDNSNTNIAPAVFSIIFGTIAGNLRGSDHEMFNSAFSSGINSLLFNNFDAISQLQIIEQIKIVCTILLLNYVPQALTSIKLK